MRVYMVHASNHQSTYIFASLLHF